MPVSIRGKEIRIAFPYNPATLAIVKELPDRTWDRTDRVWTVPATAWHARQVLDKLGKLLPVDRTVSLLATKDQHSWDDSTLDLSVNGLTPYPYQAGAVEFLSQVGGRAIIADEVGLGKTIEAIAYARHEGLTRILVVCPASVLYKWGNEIRRWYPEVADHIQVVDNSDPIRGRVIVISYDRLIRRLTDVSAMTFDLLLMDECFPYDTMVQTDQGLLPIGQIVEEKMNVKVASCGLSHCDVQYKQVVRYIKVPRHTPLLEVTHEYGSFICTINHPVYTDRGYVRADELVRGENLRVVRSAIPVSVGGQSSREAALLLEQLRGEVESGSAGAQGTTAQAGQEGIGKSAGETPTALTGADAACEPGPGVPGQGGCGAGTLASGEQGQALPYTRWEWAWPYPDTDDAPGTPAGMEGGVCGADAGSKGITHRSSEPLQDRLGLPGVEGRGRTGWELTQLGEGAGARPEEGSSVTLSRVVGVTVYEPSSYHKPDSSSGSYPYVYCLEVADNHNFFADGVLVSNCHRLKNPKTLRFKAVSALAPGIARIIGMSGTPILNRPRELFNILNILDPRAWKWFPFFNYYCGGQEHNYNGAFHLEELEERLRGVMLRRFKRDVSNQLPPFRRTVVPLVLNSEAMRNYRALLERDTKIIAHLFPHGKGYFVNDLDWLNAMRQFLEGARAEAVSEWAEDFLDSSTRETKLVIYCGFKRTLAMISDRLHPYGVQAITGDVSNAERQRIIDRWQNTYKDRVMLITSAGGEGIDLFGRGEVNCSTIVFAGREWSPAVEEQIEGRVDRTGQAYPVEAVYLVAQSTIDEDIYQLIEAKRRMLRSAVRLADVPTDIVGDLLSVLRSRGVIS